MNAKLVILFFVLDVFCGHLIFAQFELNPSFIVAQSYSSFPTDKFGFGVGIEVGYAMQNAKMELGFTSNFIWNIPSKNDFKSFTQHFYALYLKKAIGPKYHFGLEAGGLKNYFKNAPVELNGNEVFGATKSVWNQYYFNAELGYVLYDNIGIQIGCAYASGYSHIKDIQQLMISCSFTYRIRLKRVNQLAVPNE